MTNKDDDDYFENDDRGQRKLDRTYQYTMYWHYDHLTSLTFNRPKSRSQAFHFKCLEYGRFAHKASIFIAL